MKGMQSPDNKERSSLMIALIWALIPSLLAFLIAPIFGDASEVLRNEHARILRGKGGTRAAGDSGSTA